MGKSNIYIFNSKKILDNISKTLETITDIIYPPCCPVWGKVIDSKGETCRECSNVFLRVRQPVCMKCGKEIRNDIEQLCLDCSKKNLSYEKGFVLWNYDENVRKSISRFKYHNKKEYAKYYASQMNRYLGKQITMCKCDYLIPVPVHKSKLKQRGYNQAQVLARELSSCLGIPVLEDFLLRNKKTVPQKELTPKQRLNNLKQAFETTKQHDIIGLINKKTIMLVDDIYTTGSTIEACALALKRAGAGKIYYTSISIGKGYD